VQPASGLRPKFVTHFQAAKQVPGMVHR
jgi:hypothetical protein